MVRTFEIFKSPFRSSTRLDLHLSVSSLSIMYLQDPNLCDTFAHFIQGSGDLTTGNYRWDILNLYSGNWNDMHWELVYDQLQLVYDQLQTFKTKQFIFQFTLLGKSDNVDLSICVIQSIGDNFTDRFAVSENKYIKVDTHLMYV